MRERIISRVDAYEKELREKLAEFRFKYSRTNGVQGRRSGKVVLSDVEE